MRSKDIHSYLGPKTRHDNIQSCLDAVRLMYPIVQMEGSTGYDRSFWVDGKLVAHAWAVKPKNFKSEEMWLRIKEKN